MLTHSPGPGPLSATGAAHQPDLQTFGLVPSLHPGIYLVIEVKSPKELSSDHNVPVGVNPDCTRIAVTVNTASQETF